MIRVTIVEDQALVRQGLRALLALSPDLTVVAEASDGDDAVRVIREVSTDVVLLDVRLPGRSGVEVVDGLRRVGLLRPTIMLTTFRDDAVLVDAMRAGARGFLLKDAALEDLLAAIRVVAAGGTYVAPALTDHLLQAVRTRPRPHDEDEPVGSLTPREREVVRLMAAGYSNKEIADVLGSAEGTVKNHVSSILEKLAARDRTHAVVRALELGLMR